MIRVLTIVAVVAALAASAQAAAPPVARFSITVDGYEIASFHGSGGDGERFLVLERGSGTSELVSWSKSGARRNATLELHAADGTTVARYHLTDAWPAKVELGALKAGASEVLYETVTLVYTHREEVVF